MHQMKKHLKVLTSKCFIFSVPGRVRTVDPLIKSQLLYQLSYRDNSDLFSNRSAKIYFMAN
jgi:hypothetical protein